MALPEVTASRLRFHVAVNVDGRLMSSPVSRSRGLVGGLPARTRPAGSCARTATYAVRSPDRGRVHAAGPQEWPATRPTRSARCGQRAHPAARGATQRAGIDMVKLQAWMRHADIQTT